METNPPISLKEELRRQSLGYILAAFGFVTGLAWNEAIKGTIDIFFPAETGGLIIKFVYAIVVTLLLVCASIWLSKYKK